MNKDTTCIILSGGRSSRMEFDKSFLKIGDKTLIEFTLNFVKKNFNKIIIITDKPVNYNFLQIPAFKDIIPDKGPISGIHSGLKYSQTKKNFFIPVDMPFINTEVINCIVNYKTNRLITVPSSGGFIQTLCGRYDKECIEYIEKKLKSDLSSLETSEYKKNKKFKLLDLIKEVGAEIIDVSNQPFYNDDLFFNINTPADIEYVKNNLASAR